MTDRRTRYPKMFANVRVIFSSLTQVSKCVPANTLVRIERDDMGLYFRCSDGNHYLESQRDEHDECLGLTQAPMM
jgi:hypothetical protein